MDDPDDGTWRVTAPGAVTVYYRSDLLRMADSRAQAYAQVYGCAFIECFSADGFGSWRPARGVIRTLAKGVVEVGSAEGLPKLNAR